MSKSLVIVESPTKARTIGKFLGSEYHVVSSMGHIVDLPKSKLGIDIENDFSPTYVIIPSKRKTLNQLRKLVKDSPQVFIATDPDREGEAIGWHIIQRLQDEEVKEAAFLRVIFHEITARAMREAFASPQRIDINMVNAQTARRVLDRLVGYLLSPFLWKKVTKGLSAGRVQSVALRMVVEREREIQAFVPKEYWLVEAQLGTSQKEDKASCFTATLQQYQGKKLEILTQAQADRVIEELKHERFIITKVSEQHKDRFPYAPFTTSTLQQEAFNKLRFSAAKTMRVAQELYEGIEIGKGVLAGLITYMRTDSVVVSSQAIRTLRDYIKDNFGEEYVPKVARLYRSKKGAQEAHEAIRPTDVYNTPVSLKEYLTQEQFKLYELIWKRFVASQMEAARFLNTSVDIQAGYYLFKASGLELLFPGFLRLYPSQEEEGKLPAGLKEGLRLWLVRLLPSQHFTKPPPRFSEATLIRSLEDNGIGRPSTYAPTIQTLLIRGYVRSHQGYLQSSDLGITVCDMLVNNFSRIMDIRFTAQMEGRLDEVEEGRVPWSLVVKDFYLPFKENLELATQRIQKEVTPTEQVCSVCGKPMVIKWGRKGKFLSCSDFPRCKNALPITTGVKCPQPGCNGELVMRRSRRGSFYGCTNFPRCRYIATSLPQNS